LSTVGVELISAKISKSRRRRSHPRPGGTHQLEAICACGDRHGSPPALRATSVSFTRVTPQSAPTRRAKPGSADTRDFGRLQPGPRDAKRHRSQQRCARRRLQQLESFRSVCFCCKPGCRALSRRWRTPSRVLVSVRYGKPGTALAHVIQILPRKGRPLALPVSTEAGVGAIIILPSRSDYL
jgi:hypothetical protein